MAPTTQPTWLTPIRAKHSLFRRDINDGSLVSLIITAIILAILVTGIFIYLFRRTWTKLIEPRLSRSTTSQPGRGNASYRLPNLRPHLKNAKSESILPTYRESMRVRSGSDAMWSAQLDHDASSTYSADEDSETSYLPRYSSRKSSSQMCYFSHHHRSLSISSNSAFKSLDMQPIYESAEPAGHNTNSGSTEKKAARPAGPRRSMSETQVVTRATPAPKALPLGSHPVNHLDINTDSKGSMHRCSGSFDAAGRDMLRRQRSVGRLVDTGGDLI